MEIEEVVVGILHEGEREREREECIDEYGEKLRRSNSRNRSGSRKCGGRGGTLLPWWVVMLSLSLQPAAHGFSLPLYFTPPPFVYVEQLLSSSPR
jgi:hypothetical protein